MSPNQPPSDPEYGPEDARKVALVDAWFANKFNAKQAGIMVGMPPATAAQQASYLLLHDETCREYMEWKYDALRETFRYTEQKIVNELGLIGLSNMGDYVKPDGDGGVVLDLTDVNKQQWASVGEVIIDERVMKTSGGEEERTTILRRRTRLKLHDKVQALGLLLRYFGVDRGGGDALPDDRPNMLLIEGGKAEPVVIDQHTAAAEYLKMVADK